MKSGYLCFDIKGLPPLKRISSNSSKGSPKNHIYKLVINDNLYYVVKFNRSRKQVSKYFKKKKEAKAFLDLVRLTKAWH